MRFLYTVDFKLNMLNYVTKHWECAAEDIACFLNASHSQLSNDHLSRVIRDKINRSYLSTRALISKAYKVTHAFISDILL